MVKQETELCSKVHHEIEYIIYSTIVSNAIWIKRFINDLKLGISNRPVNVFYDNKSAISPIKSEANSSKEKHIGVSYYYIQDIVGRGEIKVDYVPSEKMVVDPMTKGCL